jgi:uncharacterized membrane protein YdbT with pleckstrin-like domain
MQKQSFERESQSSDAGNHEGFIEERKEILEELFERVEKYIHINIELYKLRAAEVVAEVISSTIANVLIALFAIIFFLMLNVGAAIWLGGVLGSPFAGYFLLSGVYFVVLVILWILRKNLFKNSIAGSITKKFVKD